MLCFGSVSTYVFANSEEPVDNSESKWAIDIEPSLFVSSFYDTNIYREANERIKQEDWVALISPHLLFAATGGIFRAELEMDYTAGRYADHSEDDYDDYWVETDFRWQPNHRNQFA